MKYMELIGRMAVRGTSMKRGKGKADVAIVSLAKGQKAFKPDHIYEIVDVCGELVIRDKGPSAISGHPDTSDLPLNWCWTIDRVLNQAGKYLFCTREEYKFHCEQGRQERT